MGSIRSLTGLPSKLTKMIKEPTSKVTIDDAESSALLRLKRSKNYTLAPGQQEQYATALHNRAAARKVSVGGEHFVTEVSVAVPIQVPNEIDRHSVVRLGLLVSCQPGFFPAIMSLTWLKVACLRLVLYVVSSALNVEEEGLINNELIGARIVFTHPFRARATLARCSKRRSGAPPWVRSGSPRRSRLSRAPTAKGGRSSSKKRRSWLCSNTQTSCTCSEWSPCHATCPRCLFSSESSCLGPPRAPQCEALA